MCWRPATAKNRGLETQRREINATQVDASASDAGAARTFSVSRDFIEEVPPPSSVLSLKEPDRLMARGRSSSELALPPSG